MYSSKKKIFYIGMISFLLLGISPLYADCPDKTVPCNDKAKTQAIKLATLIKIN